MTDIASVQGPAADRVETSAVCACRSATGSKTSIFASNSVPEHLVRGACAAGLLLVTFWVWSLPGALATAAAVAALSGAVVLMRGCPTCWLTGLFATVAAGRARN